MRSVLSAYTPFVIEEPIHQVWHEPDSAKVEAVQQALISWFEENGRYLPWRHTRDPWRVLVSEVMLQQIQVARAVPFYEAFVKRFPTVEALAEAQLSQAIKTWADLGRYRRVVNLHRTARIVVEEFGGAIPSDPAVLVKLPGIGPYTGGAVACFAYERDAAFVDTNARRVLHRLFLGPDVPETSATGAEILALAEALLPRDRGWVWNQAVIELGALICTARKPLCESCPSSGLCAARPTILGRLASLPRAEKAAHRYENSNRYYRGRVLARLRAAPEEGIPLRKLGEGLRESFGEQDLPWLRGVVESLEKDGLAVVERERPTSHEAVAEERPAYGTDAGNEEPAGSAGTYEAAAEARVRLP